MADTTYEDQAPVDDLTNFKDVVGDAPMQTQEEMGPMYRVYAGSKIPVSKKLGKLRKSRLEQAKRIMETSKKAWLEAIRYYHNDQQRDTSAQDGTGDASNASGLGMFNNKETENIVFANVSALVPMLYTKNPDAEFTGQSEATKPLAETLEKLMAKLSAQKNSPGLNLKRKMKRGIVMTTLTNLCWFEVGYVKRDASSEQAMADLADLSGRYQEAKSGKEIRELEGALMALESKVDMLQPAGPWVKMRKPWDVFVDPACTELDLSDANWAMIRDMIPTALLQALYGKKNPDTGEWESVYEPTHILKASTGEEDADNLQKDGFVLFSKEGTRDQYGYDDEGAYKAAQLTCVYYVWDKATRRCELYADNDWKFPVWVWDDPYHLDQFFPLVPLEFHTDPVKPYAKGEVTYYLDQQDALNLINNEFARCRAFASSLVVVNTNMIKDPNIVDQLLTGSYNKKTIPVDLPEGAKLSDAMAPALPASSQALQLFDKRPLLETIDRVSGVTSVQRGVEYKTNTTNRAIESYESQQQTRADEKMDSIEECVGGILWLVAQMCLQFMDANEVGALIGTENVKDWQQVEPKQIPIMFTPRVVGGSSLKPTSAAKKQQALQMSQIVGQFAKASPVAIILAIKILQSAFSNELVLSEDDWNMLMQSIQQQMQAQAQQNVQQGQQGQQPQGQEGSAPQQPQNGAQPDVANVITQAIAEAAKIIDGLPPEIRHEIGVMLARQVPMQQIAQVITSKLEQGTMQ